MWEADEKRFLEEVRDAIEKASGKRPRGWMAPWMASSHHTPDLLKETGFDFLMDWPADDQPLSMKTRSGPLMSVPYPIEINDSPQILVRHHTRRPVPTTSSSASSRSCCASRPEQPLVCGIALHTMVVGQPYRLRMLREALQHIDEPSAEGQGLVHAAVGDLRSLRRARSRCGASRCLADVFHLSRGDVLAHANGDGDAVFAPLYKVLKTRNVKFHFLHSLSDMGFVFGANGERHVTRLNFDAPATPLADDQVLDHFGCWPAASPISPGRTKTPIEAPADFDAVILATGVDDFHEILKGQRRWH